MCKTNTINRRGRGKRNDMNPVQAAGFLRTEFAELRLPGIPHGRKFHLASCHFIEHGDNVLVLGPPCADPHAGW